MHDIGSLRDARHIDKTFYLLADDLFYEPVDVHYDPSDEFTLLVNTMLRDRSNHWEIWRNGVWSHVGPPSGTDTNLPAQGWKVHISATDANCHEILRKVAAVALDRNVQFKFANDINTMC